MQRATYRLILHFYAITVIIQRKYTNNGTQANFNAEQKARNPSSKWTCYLPRFFYRYDSQISDCQEWDSASSAGVSAMLDN